MRIAVDVQVSNKDIGQIARLGHEIVCVAKGSEEDNKWVERALDRGAELILTDDIEIDEIYGDQVKVRKLHYASFLKEVE